MVHKLSAADSLKDQPQPASQLPASNYGAVGFAYAAEPEVSEVASTAAAAPEPSQLYTPPVEYPEYLADHLPDSERIFKVTATISWSAELAVPS